MCDRLRYRSASSYEQLVAIARLSDVVGLDERDGVAGWMWLLRTGLVSVFRFEHSRASCVAEAMLGPSFKGVVCSDFYSVYTSHDDWLHGYCDAHTICEAKKIAEITPCAVTEECRDRLVSIYATAKRASNSDDAGERRGARIRLGHLVSRLNFVEFPDIVRLE